MPVIIGDSLARRRVLVTGGSNGTGTAITGRPMMAPRLALTGTGCRKVERPHQTVRVEFFAAADGGHATLAGLQAALSCSLPGTVSFSVVAEEEHGYEEGDDDGVEGECDERVTGDNPAGKGCSDLDV
jgi:hypothetical protein